MRRRVSFDVVVETPKGSRNKYNYDPDCDCLDRSNSDLPEGMSFPFDFGFVPSTLGEDGDPLDILILDAPVVPGCVMTCAGGRRDRGETEGHGRDLAAERSADRRGYPCTEP